MTSVAKISNSTTYFKIIIISNYLVEFKIFATAYIIGGSLVAYQIGYFADRCPRRQFKTLISQ